MTFGSLSEWLFKQVIDILKGVKEVDVVFDSYTSDQTIKTAEQDWSSGVLFDQPKLCSEIVNVCL